MPVMKPLYQLAEQLGVDPDLLRKAIEQVATDKANRDAERDEAIHNAALDASEGY